MNGVNGGAAGQMPGGVAGNGMTFPVPAGYTAELSYINALVEELSRQLAENKRVLDDVVTGVGRVRNRARVNHLSNEELIAGAGDDLQAQEVNMDATISALTQALDATKIAKDEHAELAEQYAGAMATMLKQFHEYKRRHVADVAAWHRSYRQQLAEARQENCRLRDQIWTLQAHAGQANALLRDFRRRYDEDPDRWDRRVQERAMRQEIRYWKRMAMPDLAPASDAAGDERGHWSDDDDLIDPAEKIRLHELDLKAEEEQRQQAALQQQLLQQQQRLQQQQHQYEQQMAASAAAEAAHRAASMSAVSGSAGAAPAADPPRDEHTAADTAYADDSESRGAAGGVGDVEELDLANGDCLPAVPQAPSSAPTPLSISRMGSYPLQEPPAEAHAEGPADPAEPAEPADPEPADTESPAQPDDAQQNETTAPAASADESDSEGVVPTPPPRPSSAASSTGSSGY